MVLLVFVDVFVVGGVWLCHVLCGWWLVSETIARQKKDLEDSLDKMLANMQQVSDIIGSLSAQAEQLAAVAQGNMSATGLN